MGIREIGWSNILGTSAIVIASAATITISNNIHRITGNTNIGTILLPPGDPYFNGALYLYNTDASVGTWDTSGNIALGGTLTRYHVFTFIFDFATQLWYPSAIS